MRIAFLGGGRMAGALLSGLLDHAWIPDDLAVADPSKEALDRLDPRIPRTGLYRSALELLRSVCPEVAILAVKPKDVEELIESIGSAGHALPPLIISIAAGISTSRIEEYLGGKSAVIRAMPNTPALVGKGMTALATGRFACPEHLVTAERILSAVGDVLVVEERQMDAVTAISGSGPAYVFHFMKALAEAGEAEGLPGETARRLVLATVAGAAELASRSRESFEEMITAVASKGGTTEAALEVLKRGGATRLLQEAVGAARRRSEELGR